MYSSRHPGRISVVGENLQYSVDAMGSEAYSGTLGLVTMAQLRPRLAGLRLQLRAVRSGVSVDRGGAVMCAEVSFGGRDVGVRHGQLEAVKYLACADRCR